MYIPIEMIYICSYALILATFFYSGYKMTMDAYERIDINGEITDKRFMILYVVTLPMVIIGLTMLYR